MKMASSICHRLELELSLLTQLGFSFTFVIAHFFSQLFQPWLLHVFVLESAQVCSDDGLNRKDSQVRFF